MNVLLKLLDRSILGQVLISHDYSQKSINKILEYLDPYFGIHMELQTDKRYFIHDGAMLSPLYFDFDTLRIRGNRW